jgi:hypothetical protein
MKPAARRKLTLKVEIVKVLSSDELVRIVGGGESESCPTTTARPSWCCHPP